MGQFEFGSTVVTKITFNPNDSHQVCTSGVNHWKLWRIQENTFKPMPNFQGVGNHTFTDHCWLGDDKLAGCTSEGEIIILEEFMQKQIIENAFMSEQIYGVSCIQPYSKGFFIASDDGMMALWVRSEENNQSSNQENQNYDFIRRWSPVVTKGTKIITMDVNSSEEYVSAACSNNNIALVNIKSIGLNENLTRDVKVDLVSKGFHSGAISCIDVAVQRPLFVTCSQDDSTIRIWNYYTNKCEQVRELFAKDDTMILETVKPLLTVAIHPSGYYLAAGCKDKIRIYHILHDELRTFRCIERRLCSKLKFSNGGQYLACIVLKHIYIYKSYTLECIFSEKISCLHVTDIRFSKNDTCLCIVSADGFMQRWIYDNGFTKLNDGAVCSKSIDFRSCCFVNGIDDDLKVIAAGGDSDKSTIRLVSYKDEVLQNYSGTETKITSGDVINTHNKISNFVVGTETGSLKGKF
jgi:WD40 repeat protein